MVEHIRTKLMESTSNRRDGANKDTWVIAPNYRKRLELEKKNASCCRVVCAGLGIWQVTCGDSQYVVDLGNHKCGCYKWDITGVPCCHAVAAIHKFKQKPEEYMSIYFTREKYIAAYEGIIMPVPDKTQWLRTDFPDVDPPLYHAQPGRPRKKRVRAQGEPYVEARASKKATIRCSNCKKYGHNIKGCGEPIRPDWEPRKGAKFTRASMGLPPVSNLSQLGGSQTREPTSGGSSSQRRASLDLPPVSNLSQPNTNSQRRETTHCSTSQPPATRVQSDIHESIFMNNDQGIGLYHDIEGGPRISPHKLFPFRKRTS